MITTVVLARIPFKPLPYKTCHSIWIWINPFLTVFLPHCRDDSMFAPRQWETSLQSNAVSHWLGANLESAMHYHDNAMLASWHGNAFCITDTFSVDSSPKRTVMRSCDVFFSLAPNKLLNKQLSFCVLTKRSPSTVCTSVMAWLNRDISSCNETPSIYTLIHWPLIDVAVIFKE